MRIETNTLTPALFLQLYTAVGWEAPGLAQIEAALRHTLAAFVAYEGEAPLGMVRLLGDGGMSFYIKDFAVLPAHRARGWASCCLPPPRSTSGKASPPIGR